LTVPLTKDFVAAVRNAGDIVRLVGDYVPLKQGGARLKGLCPFHHEKTPSFSVDPQLQLFYCFGCQTGGDSFKFIMLYEKLSFAEAVEFLARRWGVPLPKAAARPEHDARERLLLMNEMAATHYRMCLTEPQGRIAADYLVKRGVGEETSQRFGLGYAPDSWESLTQLLGARGFAPAEMQEAGLTVRRKDGTGQYDRFRHRLVFPIRDAAGRVVAFGGRALGDSEPKYHNSPETPTYVKGDNLYGLDVAKEAIRREGFAILVEGYLDLIVLHQAGFDNAVASLGTALTTSQVRLLSRFSERIVVSYDGDPAGRNAASKSIDLLLERGFEVRVAEIPGGRDPDEFVRQEGAGAYETLVRGAAGFIEFLLKKEITGRDLDRPGERVAVINALLPRLAHLPHAVERAAWAGRLAEALNLDDDLVLHELRSALKAAKPSIRQRAGEDDPVRDVEARLVAVLLGSEEARRHARAAIGSHELDGTRVGVIVRAILSCEEGGGAIPAASFVDALDNDEDRALLTRIAFRDEPPGGPEAVDGCLEMLNHARWRRESHDVARAVPSQDRDEQTDRLNRLMELGRRMDAPHRTPTLEN
jgi:DNA primase